MVTVDTGLQHCPRCALDVARTTCRATKAGAETLLLCGACGGVTRAVTVTAREPLMTVYLRSWRYVATFDGWIALVALSLGGWILSFIPLVGGMASAGVKLAYFFSVIRATSRGSDDLPHAADFIDWSDVIRPTVRSLLACGVAFAPLMAALAGAADARAMAPLVALAALWGVAYLPGAMIAASLHEGYLGGANPFPVIELMRRIPRDYALTTAVLLALALASLLCTMFFAMVRIPVPVVSTVVNLLLGAVALAGPLAMARILGLLLRERADELSLDE
jgi:hypothetical protein